MEELTEPRTPLPIPPAGTAWRRGGTAGLSTFLSFGQKKAYTQMLLHLQAIPLEIEIDLGLYFEGLFFTGKNPPGFILTGLRK